ncbi:MAG TPA: GNAT family N-acetyltransferase [Chloroflexota bacterium]|nr:GNAT family N-acetyltransferase [Chloroflexota bacterium]
MVRRDGPRILLETERLRLREFVATDLNDLYALNNDPVVMRFINGGMPTPLTDVRDRILARYMELTRDGSALGQWAAIERSSGLFIGRFGLIPRQADRVDELDIGYRLRKESWNRGYATEGARALIRLAFDVIGADAVFATTYEHNAASRRVMDKAGMRLLRRFRMTPEQLKNDGAHHAVGDQVWDGEDVEYVITREEWSQIAAGC